MLTLIERVKYHLNQPYTLGWDWTADALIEELTAKLQDTGLPVRLREVYTSLKLELLLCCSDAASWGDSIEDDTEDLDAEEVDAPVYTLASGRPRPVLRTPRTSLPRPVLRQQKPAPQDTAITDAGSGFVPPTLTDTGTPDKRYAVFVGNLFVGIADLCDAQYITGTTEEGWVLPLPPSNDVLKTYNTYRYKGMPMTVTNDGGYSLSPEMEAGIADPECRSRFDTYEPCCRYTLTLGDVCGDVDPTEFYYKGYPTLGWELNSQLSGVYLETAEGRFEVEFPTHLSKIGSQRPSYKRRRSMVATACSK